MSLSPMFTVYKDTLFYQLKFLIGLFNPPHKNKTYISV